MQQAIYTNVQGSAHTFSGHGTGSMLESLETVPQERRFKKLRLVFSVIGNVMGGTLLLSGMLMLPQLLVSLLGS